VVGEQLRKNFGQEEEKLEQDLWAEYDKLKKQSMHLKHKNK
jgi:hypothetical protein